MEAWNKSYNIRAYGNNKKRSGSTLSNNGALAPTVYHNDRSMGPWAPVGVELQNITTQTANMNGFWAWYLNDVQTGKEKALLGVGGPSTGPSGGDGPSESKQEEGKREEPEIALETQ
jgi:hypothetical protein